MFKPLDEKDFTDKVKQSGYIIEETKKNHYKILDKNDNILMSFAIKHKKGSKREVKAFYVNQFDKLSEKYKEHPDE